MSSCVRFPHRRELSHLRYLASLNFLCTVGQLKLLFLWPPYFPPWIILYLTSCGLFLLCRSYHVGVTCIFVVGWGCNWVAYWKSDPEISKSQQCCRPSMSGKALLPTPQGTYYKQKLLLETWHELWVSVNTSNTCISCGHVYEVMIISLRTNDVQTAHCMEAWGRLPTLLPMWPTSNSTISSEAP